MFTSSASFSVSQLHYSGRSTWRHSSTLLILISPLSCIIALVLSSHKWSQPTYNDN